MKMYETAAPLKRIFLRRVILEFLCFFLFSFF